MQRIGEPGESPAFSPVIFRTRYLQLARVDELSSEQFARLAVALAEDPELWHAWRLLQQLYQIYDAPDEKEAAARIEVFVHAWAETRIPEFRSVLHALAKWLPEILAFHRCGRVTNGPLEGQMNKSVFSSASPTGLSTPTTSRRGPCCGVLRWHHERAE